MTKRKVEKIALIISIALLILLLTSFAGYKLSKARTYQIFGGITSRVNTTEKVVALTFDDGPTSQTNAVLDILKAKNTKATIYVAGKDLANQPESGKAIAMSGHELGNHSYYHNTMIFKTPSSVNSELSETNRLIRETGYTGNITFRPPYGKKLILLPWILKQNNMKTIMWDIEPDTYHSGNTSDIVSHTVNNVKPGSIIIMHPFCESRCQADREAIPLIIDNLKANGYKFVTISDLLKTQKMQANSSNK